MIGIRVNATLLAFHRDFAGLLGGPVSPALVAVMPAVLDLQPGDSGVAVFADQQERPIRRDARGFVHLDGPETLHAED